MTTVKRRGRLTYERLISSLNQHHSTIGAQLTDLKGTGRAQDLHGAINDALATARAGMSGARVVSPAQLKQEVKAHIAAIHEGHDVIDEADAPAQNNTQTSVFTSSAAGDNHNPYLASCQQTSAIKRTRSTKDCSKENAVPPGSQVVQPSAHKLSAVKKTPITKRTTNSKPSISAGVKKRQARTTRSKTVTQDVTATPLSTTDEADRRAAAAALLGLAEHSPETSFTSSSSFITPSTNGKKRAYSVHEDGASPHHWFRSQEPASSSPAPKRPMSAPKTYAPVPILAQGLSLPEAFTLGVEYTVQHLPSNLRSDGEEMRIWVEKQLGLHIASDLDNSHSTKGSNAGGGMSTTQGAVTLRSSTADGGKKGFWDVV